MDGNTQSYTDMRVSDELPPSPPLQRSSDMNRNNGTNNPRNIALPVPCDFTYSNAYPNSTMTEPNIQQHERSTIRGELQRALSNSSLSNSSRIDDDEDYRSETSSEATPKAKKQPVSISFSNHRDLSIRLRQAIMPSQAYSEHLFTSNEDVQQMNDTSPLNNITENTNDQSTMDSMNQCDLFGPDTIGTDVTIIVINAENNDIEDDKNHNEANDTCTHFYAHRFMLATASKPLRVMLTGKMREATSGEVKIRDVEPIIVQAMLIFIYTGDVTLTHRNVLGLLVASEMYEITALQKICRRFVLQHANTLFRDSRFIQLPEALLLDLVKHDELQIRELVLMESLVKWGQARLIPSLNSIESNANSMLEILAPLMEHVRFPTMSVSDLYGKVRPLVKKGIIKESLLTEALFYHLNWGLQSGRAAERMKPRAVAAALRKRKRVSFIQHVSFVPE